jgi:hypothetical protein
MGIAAASIESAVVRSNPGVVRSDRTEAWRAIDPFTVFVDLGRWPLSVRCSSGRQVKQPLEQLEEASRVTQTSSPVEDFATDYVTAAGLEASRKAGV